MWSNERELEFLESYYNESVLWNPKDLKHKDKQCIQDAWNRISDQVGIPVADLKKKRESLMATYRSHKRKVNASLQSGATAEAVYRPIWFAFEFMDSFLGDLVNCRKTINAETQENPSTPECEGQSQAMHDNEYRSEAQFSSSLPTIQRRRKDPMELQEAGRIMKEAMITLKKALNKREMPADDYDRYGKILANKLRKLSEQESLEMMYEIDGLFIRRIKNASCASPTHYMRPLSVCTLYSLSDSEPSNNSYAVKLE